ncbi:hypothetical protein D3870_06610 [Noviherbaspirillum cavernae]|uniref:Uncharacterized protein n=1 Tax=Noviherbaspirillum cavernae TaxID=2320862 RepID=A0A418WZU9_9BURK|nr:hypothetical protein D3870_06610 [Noviherbaspirillum cavernae]
MDSIMMQAGWDGLSGPAVSQHDLSQPDQERDRWLRDAGTPRSRGADRILAGQLVGLLASVRGCAPEGLRGTGGDGLLYCFAVK